MPQTIEMVLSDMLHAIEGIERAVRGREVEDLDKDWLLKHGLQRGIEIISEASRRIPNELKSLRPEVPWKDTAACCAMNVTGFQIGPSGTRRLSISRT